MCSTLNLDDESKELIEKLRIYIGANQLGKGDYASSLIEYLKKGIVVHHGSLPLEGRKIIEEFTRKGHCRLCFATSTLDQGINMPFDLVWIERFEPSKPLNVWISLAFLIRAFLFFSFVPFHVSNSCQM